MGALDIQAVTSDYQALARMAVQFIFCKKVDDEHRRLV